MWENWSQWSTCTSTCGDNDKTTRSRGVKLHAQNNGKKCIRPLSETKQCDVLPECQGIVKL